MPLCFGAVKYFSRLALKQVMDTRRDFIKKASLLAGGAGLLGALPASVQKAVAIDPPPDSTFEDAAHIVLLMQENRSFDHSFGTLQGVRGFNDPHAIRLPDKNLVWLQSNEAGETYLPFRLDIKDTKATWMSSLPHSWTSQVDARNGGRHDNWLQAKRSGNKEYADLPLTMGYYNREDLPFYYALADAFTVCDQHFCSSLTGTTPNRLYFWTGTLREEPHGASPANVDNSDVDYDTPASWTTFPERLEENGISWKIYQNELSLDVGFEGEQDPWLANFTDNPIEWFSQYHVRFLPSHVRYLRQRKSVLEKEIAGSDKTTDAYKKKQQELDRIKTTLEEWNEENFDKLPEREKNLHSKAFTTNVNDPSYHELASLRYDDNGTSREMQIPKGDVLHQFREDVKSGKLPTVSWLVAPENFSDHPGAPWYGAWYVSEVLDILTQNPEVWKKTIFILTYDENDGYFDHVPPFVAPDPSRPETGKTSAGISIEVDYVTKEQADALKGKPKDPERVSPVGLGFRVPFVVASPWTRGGWVNSQVFDHTSVLQFMEKFLSRKTGKQIVETNISSWRRAVCGDLTSVFRPYHGEKITLPAFVEKKPFVESIYNAQFKKIPSAFKALAPEEIAQVNYDPSSLSWMPEQEKGIRSSCALPYEVYAHGKQDDAHKSFEITLQAGNEIFGERAAGVPFNMYDLAHFAVRNYAVAAGEQLTDNWTLPDDGSYHFCVYGPNGFLREFSGSKDDPAFMAGCGYERKKTNRKKLTGNIELQLHNLDNAAACTVEIRDNAYRNKTIARTLRPGASAKVILDLKRSFGWYDFTVGLQGNEHFARRCAGRVETGEAGFSDPVMGRVNV